MKRVALVIGHNNELQGALDEATGEREFEYFQNVATEIAMRLENTQAAIFYRRSGQQYYNEMREVTRSINRFDPDVVIELHFNSFDGKHNGTCCLIWPRSRAYNFAMELSKVASSALGTVDNGVIYQERSWSKSKKIDGKYVPAGALLYILKDTKCPAVILETHYGDHDGDTSKSSTNWIRMCIGIAKLIDGYEFA